jgi:hypothetical protein
VDVEDQLRDAFARSLRGVDPPVHALVTRAVREGRSARRSRLAVWGAGAAAAAAVVVAVAVTSPWDDTRSVGPAAPAASCEAGVEDTVLPTWARTGFTDPEPVVRHVLGDDGRIVAILFGQALHAPPAPDVSNKVLWVARTAGDTLSIDAVRAEDGKVAHREVAGGPGPSTIDLPGAGCWHLTLRWGDAPESRDTMDLEYVAPR